MRLRKKERREEGKKGRREDRKQEGKKTSTTRLHTHKQVCKNGNQQLALLCAMNRAKEAEPDLEEADFVEISVDVPHGFEHVVFESLHALVINLCVGVFLVCLSFIPGFPHVWDHKAICHLEICFVLHTQQ